MKTACFIPIKLNSERVPGKNFRVLNGKKLYEYIIEHSIEAACFDEIFVDTNSEEIAEYALAKNLKVIPRLDVLAQNTANGNDLLVYHGEKYPEFDYYFQLFATAPFLQPESIRKCVDRLVNTAEYDSCMTVCAHQGYYWFREMPINYRPDILPRSQDMHPVYEETTGMYGITSEALRKYQCRIGKNPYMHSVSKFEAVDINTEEDLLIAEYIGKVYWKY